MGSTLESLFDGDEEESEPMGETVEAEEPEEVEETESEEPEETEEEDAPPASEEKKPPEGMVPQAALADERAKRQELQRQIDELRSQFQKPKEPEKEPEPIDFLDDPDKWAAQLQSKYETALKSVEQSAQQRFLQLSENMARARHSDFDDAAQVFSAAVKDNPALAAEAMKAPDPAEYVYQSGMRLKRLSDAGGDLEKLIEQERQRAREEALAEFQRTRPKAAEMPNIPESLNNVTGSKSPRKVVDEDISLEQLFPNF